MSNFSIYPESAFPWRTVASTRSSAPLRYAQFRAWSKPFRGIGRVLKPGGKFIFFEHGLAPEPPVRQWQERTEPFFQWAFEGCHVTRDIPSLIKDGGFDIEQMDTGYLAPFPKCATHCF